MSRCPWCGKESSQMVKVAYFTDRDFMTADVCPDCRKRFMKRLRESVVGRK